jgi:hypothetical protein
MHVKKEAQFCDSGTREALMVSACGWGEGRLEIYCIQNVDSQVCCKKKRQQEEVAISVTAYIRRYH